MGENHYRKRLDKVHPSITYSFRVASTEGYMHAGLYEDETLGELFIKISKEGSTLRGLFDSIAVSVSLGLQYGTPLYEFVEKHMNMKFEPDGSTNDPDIPKVTSIADYIFRRLGMDFLSDEEKVKLGLAYEAPALSQ